MQISKSDYMLFLRHPAWLWLKKHDKSKLPPVNEQQQAIFDAGYLFESYAEQLFPGGVRVGFEGYDEYLTMPQRTAEALAGDVKTIFQGRFEHEQLTFICDVINLVGDETVDLYEIKSSTRAKPEHILDLAFQMTVLEGCGFTVRNIAVLHVNNQFVRAGEADPNELTAISYVTDLVKAKRAITKTNIEQALACANLITPPSFSPSLAKMDACAEWLDIYRSLVEVEPDSIYDLCSVSASTCGQLEELGITWLTDVPANFKLTTRQTQQVKSAKLGTPIINKEKIQEFLGTLVYPLYFFDYETMMGVVPNFDGMCPYKQYPFQYSLHILDAPGAELRQLDYLHKDNSDPTEPLSKILHEQIGTSGSVITWNMSFEKGCNDLMGSVLPDYCDFYNSLNLRIVDLMTPFSNGWYVDKGFMGSASIKKVLPVVVPELSYKSLNIQEGAGAQRIWMETVLDGKHDSEKEQILADMIEYCKMDTYAMVRIFETLTELCSATPKITQGSFNFE